MYDVHIPPAEFWDDDKQEFVYTKEYSFTIEHSLISVSKWEALYRKPYLSEERKTPKEDLDYVRCMTVTKNVPDEAYEYLTADELKRISDYVNDTPYATWFSDTKPHRGGSSVTAEVIYYWMTMYGIPFECQKWHLNRLMCLIRVCLEKSGPQEKMTKSEILRQNAALNAARKKKFGTKG